LYAPYTSLLKSEIVGHEVKEVAAIPEITSFFDAFLTSSLAGIRERPQIEIVLQLPITIG